MDEEDYRHVLSGSNDLAGCVLKGADFKGMLLPGRNFGNSKLEGANFKGGNLEGSSFKGASINHADFSNANLRRTHFNGGIVKANFSGANLSDARLEGVYLGVDFRDSNLSGSNFSGAHFNEGCLFDGAIVSEKTLFDGTHALRPYSRLASFRYYRFERGVLHRIPLGEIDVDQDRLRLDAIDALTSGIQELGRIPLAQELQSDNAGIGHNNPPEEFQLKAAEIETAQLRFTEARDALLAKDRNIGRYQRAIESAKTLAHRSAVWSGHKFDLPVSEFAKEFGKTLGGKAALVVATLHFTGALERIVYTLTRFMEALL